MKTGYGLVQSSPGLAHPEKSKNKHVTKEQDAKSEDRKNPKETNRNKWRKAPDVLQESTELTKKKGGGGAAQILLNFFPWWVFLIKENREYGEGENDEWKSTETGETGSVCFLYSIYTRLSGKIDHIADVQVRKTQTKSIPVPCWEIHYSKVNSLHSVFPCAWFPPQTGHTACRGICWDLFPKCGLTTPRLHVSSGTFSQLSYTYRVLNSIHLGQEGTPWIFSCNYQSWLEPDLTWLPTNHQLGFTYQGCKR